MLFLIGTVCILGGGEGWGEVRGSSLQKVVDHLN